MLKCWQYIQAEKLFEDFSQMKFVEKKYEAINFYQFPKSFKLSFLLKTSYRDIGINWLFFILLEIKACVITFSSHGRFPFFKTSVSIANFKSVSSDSLVSPLKPLVH